MSRFVYKLVTDGDGNIEKTFVLKDEVFPNLTFTKTGIGAHEIVSDKSIFANVYSEPLCVAKITDATFPTSKYTFELFVADANTLALKTYDNGVLSDNCFGDYVILDVEIFSDVEYTDTELSAISHAQSILYRAGLKDLALTIGAPRPKKP